MKSTRNYDKMFLVLIRLKDNGRDSGKPDRKSRTFSGKGEQETGNNTLTCSSAMVRTPWRYYF